MDEVQLTVPFYCPSSFAWDTHALWAAMIGLSIHEYTCCLCKWAHLPPKTQPATLLKLLLFSRNNSEAKTNLHLLPRCLLSAGRPDSSLYIAPYVPLFNAGDTCPTLDPTQRDPDPYSHLARGAAPFIDHHPITYWSPSDHLLITIWSLIDHHLITYWSPSDHLLITIWGCIGYSPVYSLFMGVIYVIVIDDIWILLTLRALGVVFLWNMFPMLVYRDKIYPGDRSTPIHMKTTKHALINTIWTVGFTFIILSL